MTRTDRVWNHADAAFKSADAAFAEAEKLFADLPPAGTHTEVDSVHHLRFAANGVKGRWKLGAKFFRMGCVALFTGKTELRFKDKK